jgi:uncharacterized membrane protein SpoIIM required for sporulation
MEKYLMIWIIEAGLLFMLFTKKNTDLGQFSAQYMAWILCPLVFILAAIEAYCRRKRLRWLKKYWFCISLNQSIKYLTNYRGKFYK